ncbi:hypothetical protein P154DRAFT_581273 [Amniculicola lignicola CBS 123094]|uniref:Uncharacterized protein n=1 Tax=Amniculicola lignicola CBS 123094 TaxID=1392246 RepID=A0A6A5W192_9PLEO|nr:hypothetical protein P154DRAFT_581273 [Amniculicola lignicola CBS 123094]
MAAQKQKAGAPSSSKASKKPKKARADQRAPGYETARELAGLTETESHGPFSIFADLGGFGGDTESGSEGGFMKTDSPGAIQTPERIEPRGNNTDKGKEEPSGNEESEDDEDAKEKFVARERHRGRQLVRRFEAHRLGIHFQSIKTPSYKCQSMIYEAFSNDPDEEIPYMGDRTFGIQQWFREIARGQPARLFMRSLDTLVTILSAMTGFWEMAISNSADLQFVVYWVTASHAIRHDRAVPLLGFEETIKSTAD